VSSGNNDRHIRGLPSAASLARGSAGGARCSVDADHVRGDEASIDGTGQKNCRAAPSSTIAPAADRIEALSGTFTSRTSGVSPAPCPMRLAGRQFGMGRYRERLAGGGVLQRFSSGGALRNSLLSGGKLPPRRRPGSSWATFPISYRRSPKWTPACPGWQTRFCNDPRSGSEDARRRRAVRAQRHWHIRRAPTSAFSDPIHYAIDLQ
jgi:hypothetical protein